MLTNAEAKFIALTNIIIQPSPLCLFSNAPVAVCHAHHEKNKLIAAHIISASTCYDDLYSL
jgi:hypothetical protein